MWGQTWDQFVCVSKLCIALASTHAHLRTYLGITSSRPERQTGCSPRLAYRSPGRSRDNVLTNVYSVALDGSMYDGRISADTLMTRVKSRASVLGFYDIWSSGDLAAIIPRFAKCAELLY